MSIHRNLNLRLETRRSLYIALCCVTWVANAFAQTAQNRSENVAQAIAEVQSGNWAQIGRIVATAGPVKSIPILKDLFVSSQDSETKERIASALYKLGQKDAIYWDFMAGEATLAVERDAPFPHPYNTHGSMQEGLSPVFIEWAKAHNVSATSAEKIEWDGYNRILVLAMTGDPRAIPILRRGLASPDHLIESISAKGLAQFQDKDSIQSIIEAAQRAPSDAAVLIAESLVYFDDPRAQGAADVYLPKEKATALREHARIHGSKPFNSLSAP